MAASFLASAPPSHPKIQAPPTLRPAIIPIAATHKVIYNTFMLETHPLASHVASITGELRAQAATSAARAGVLAALHALLFAALVRLFDQLACMVDLWRAGQLPASAPATTRPRTPLTAVIGSGAMDPRVLQTRAPAPSETHGVGHAWAATPPHHPSEPVQRRPTPARATIARTAAAPHPAPQRHTFGRVVLALFHGPVEWPRAPPKNSKSPASQSDQARS